jgi:hypothetical protein
VTSLVVGLLAGAVVGLLGAPELWPLVAWIVATGIVLSWLWRIIWPQDAAGTERLAEAEGRSSPGFTMGRKRFKGTGKTRLTDIDGTPQSALPDPAQDGRKMCLETGGRTRI